MRNKTVLTFLVMLWILLCIAISNIFGRDIPITGKASWYGPKFHSKKTANGEIYNQNDLTAASNYLPFNTIVRVVRITNGNSVDVRINDRGPFICKEKIDNKCTKWEKHPTRIIDLSKAAMMQLDPTLKLGVIEVRLIWKEEKN